VDGEALESVLAKPDIHVARGHFDPVLASHARRLASAGRPLLVLITEPEDALMPARARAELVAALGTVDYVALATPELATRVPFMTSFEEDDRRDREALERLVQERS